MLKIGKDVYEYLRNVSCLSYLQKKLSDPSLFECDNCDYQAITLAIMEKHMSQTKYSSDRFKCKICDFKSFRVKNYGT